MAAKVVLETVDWRGETVKLSNSQWKHIRNGHPEMSDQLDAIAVTISDPDVVTVSDTLAMAPKGVRHIASRRDAHTKYSQMYVRVPIEYSPAGNWVTTAYLNLLPPEGELVYVRVAPR